jgi:hypothetical protein
MSWSRSEPVREWTALTLLAESAPGLAPIPITADLSGDPPTLTMSWLPGAELGTVPTDPALGEDPTVARAHAAAVGWLDHRPAERDSSTGHRTVLGHGDPCLANFLWDAGQVRLVDFEDSGPSDRAFELAILTEHISAWSDASLDVIWTRASSCPCSA